MMSDTLAHHHHLRTLSSTDVREPIPTPQLVTALQSPPFVYVPGTFNTRDLGSLAHLMAGAGAGCPPRLRAGYVYRSGSLEGLTLDGQATLQKLGVKKIFDLRSVAEHEHKPDPEVPGVEVVWQATTELEAVVDLEDFVEGDGERGYQKMYLDVLKVYAGVFRAVLEHILRDDDDKGESGILVHCTAGRDRTGVLSGLLLSLAGTPPDLVELDFMLSRIGTEPAREQLLAFALKGSGAESVEAPGFYNLCSLKVQCWRAFVKGVEREYGGWEGYVRKQLGFSPAELETIKRNLVTPR
ncbi:tyrosine-protein phosphatase [Diplogelasinospora grovesii]|uniref:Tyrosine-protein phosphatase n=1 Tax=Diplogelasinospora grovesii TaxID=303347 RepID=A0AAN6SA00_9PEZI|nr:tyrosine-protein phosphatase [Diplogelasinospora grovesii]